MNLLTSVLTSRYLAGSVVANQWLYPSDRGNTVVLCVRIGIRLFCFLGLKLVSAVIMIRIPFSFHVACVYLRTCMRAFMSVYVEIF